MAAPKTRQDHLKDIPAWLEAGHTLMSSASWGNVEAIYEPGLGLFVIGQASGGYVPLWLDLETGEEPIFCDEPEDLLEIMEEIRPLEEWFAVQRPPDLDADEYLALTEEGNDYDGEG